MLFVLNEMILKLGITLLYEKNWQILIVTIYLHISRSVPDVQSQVPTVQFVLNEED